LKCVIYYPIALVIGLKKDIITYKITNGIFALNKHFQNMHSQMWTQWIEQEKDGPQGERKFTKKQSSPTPSTISFFVL
jgi:hypothetical protein